MRLLLSLTLVGSLAACATLHPVNQPKLPGSFTDIQTIPRLSPHHVLAIKKDGGVEAYVIWQAEDAPIRVHTWRGATDFRLCGYKTFARGQVEDALIETSSGVELYGIGEWDEPRLSAAVMQTHKIGDYLTILPVHSEDAWWRGLAVRDGDPQSPQPWRFFASDDGTHWGPMKITGVTGPVLDVRRFGPAQMALRTADGWRLYRKSDSLTWSVFDPPGVHGPYRAVDPQVDGETIGLATDDGQAKTWFWWVEEGWQPMDAVLPGAPARAVSVHLVTEGLERGAVVAVRPATGPNAFEDQYYVHGDPDWVPLHDRIHDAPAQISDARSFAEGRGLTLTSKPTADAPRPVVTAWWWERECSRQGTTESATIRLCEGRWIPLASEVPGLASDIWEIVPAGSDAFAVRTGKPLGWQWFFRTEKDEERWLPLESMLPPGTPSFAQAAVWMALAAAIKAENDNPAQPAVDEHLFIRRGHKFVPFTDVIKTTWKPAALVTEDYDPENLIRVTDTARQMHYLLREEGGQWADLSEQLNH